MRALRIPRFYTKCLYVESWLDTLLNGTTYKIFRYILGMLVPAIETEKLLTHLNIVKD